MSRIVFSGSALIAFISAALSVNSVSGQEVIPLGAGQGRAAMPEVAQEMAPFGKIVRNVSEPSLTAYLPQPEKATGAAVIVAPGGAFHFLAIDHEGAAVARLLNDQGVAVFVLKYHLLPTDASFQQALMAFVMDAAGLSRLRATVQGIRPSATSDAQNAIKWVRKNGKRYGLDPARVGLMGFSAGGAVAVWTLLAADPDSRPDFSVAVYPGILPPDLPVPEHAPPLFVAVADDDLLARTDSLRLATAWKNAGVPTELKTYPTGGHGFGVARTGKPTDAWTGDLIAWMRKEGVLEQ